MDRLALARASGALGLLLAACTSTQVANGTFHSPKGYRVGIPGDGWRVEPAGKADLELARQTPPGGMLANATCEGASLGRSLPVLARQLTFGLTDRQTVESDAWTVGGRPAAHRVIQGRRDGVEVAVEAVVVRGQRCIHDFLYVAPLADFERGRGDFKVFVESFAGDSP